MIADFFFQVHKVPGSHRLPGIFVPQGGQWPLIIRICYSPKVRWEDSSPSAQNDSGKAAF